MNRVLKTFLLWLLIAALPLQGMAAVIKASCGPRHHDMSSVMMMKGHHSHDEATAPHQHDDAGNTVVADDAQKASAKKSAEAKQGPHLSYCSACAACCFGAAAPPPSVSLTPDFSTVEAAVIPPVVSFTGFIPAGLERPPRHLSA
ncbi:hypothetical protein [Noviherbaspirillum malthae]|uniref:hypothetical protein n=1 Tax=Noviherbaspirillum malthae TaxID=1260987 RepID=UPI00188DDFDA|nr:hypothetical protein [Noviherbaspirillum malthae]